MWPLDADATLGVWWLGLERRGGSLGGVGG